MKKILFMVVLVTCNQQIYDRIYFELMVQAGKGHVTRSALMLRYNSVMTLRNLCNGQLSTYEKNNPLEGK